MTLKGARRSDADEHAEACGGTDGQRIYDQKPAVEFLGDDLRVTREAGYQRKMLGEIDLRLTEKEGARIPNKCSQEIGIVLPPKECVAAHQQLPPADNIGNAR